MRSIGVQVHSEQSMFIVSAGLFRKPDQRICSMMHHSDINDRKLLMMRIHGMIIMQALI
jgi:hypothetical protein